MTEKEEEEVFDIGDWTYLKLRPYRQQTLPQKAWHKLGNRFYGPFQVIARVGEVAYKLELPEGSQIHPVVYVSQLKRRVGSGDVTMSSLPEVNKDGVPMVRPVQAREYRLVKREGRFLWEVLIEWEGLPTEEATWENLEEIRNRFPDFVLEAMTISMGIGMVKTRLVG